MLRVTHFLTTGKLLFDKLHNLDIMIYGTDSYIMEMGKVNGEISEFSVSTSQKD